MRMTGDYYLASDMLQESFTRLLDRYPSNAWCKALLFRVARNAMIDEKRKLRDGKRQALTENHGAQDHEHDLMIRESYREVLKALQDLDPMEQDMPAAGRLVFTDGLEQLEVNSEQEALREAYGDSFQQRMQRMQSTSRKHAIPLIMAHTALPVLDQVRDKLGQHS